MRGLCHDHAIPQFVVMTGDGGKDEVVQALRLGVTDFIDKPFELEDVCNVIDSACNELTSIAAPVRSAGAERRTTASVGCLRRCSNFP